MRPTSGSLCVRCDRRPIQPCWQHNRSNCPGKNISTQNISTRSVVCQGCSKVGPGHSKPETRRPKAERSPKAEVRIDSHPGGATANRIRPFSEFGLRSSDFRAAEHALPSTGPTLEQPWWFANRCQTGCQPSLLSQLSPPCSCWRRYLTTRVPVLPSSAPASAAGQVMSASWPPASRNWRHACTLGSIEPG